MIRKKKGHYATIGVHNHVSKAIVVGIQDCSKAAIVGYNHLSTATIVGYNNLSKMVAKYWIHQSPLKIVGTFQLPLTNNVTLWYGLIYCT